MKIIVINGAPCSGKDTFIQLCQKVHSSIHNFSTIDYVKEVASKLGWDGKKDERGRKFLSDLKDAMTDYDDIPFKKIIAKIDMTLSSYRRFGQSTDDIIFFIHCREPKEIEKFVKQFNAKTLLVRRPVIENIQHDNHADNNIMDYDYDFTYINEYDLERMEEDAVAFIKWIANQNWSCNTEELKGDKDEELY